MDPDASLSVNASEEEDEIDGQYTYCACGRKVTWSEEHVNKKIEDLKQNNRELAKKLENSEMIIAEQMKQLASFTQRTNYAVCTSSKIHEVMVRMSNMAVSMNDVVSLLSEVSSYAKKATGFEELEQTEQTQTMTLRVPEAGLDDVFNGLPLISVRNGAINEMDRMSAIREDSLCNDDPGSTRGNAEKVGSRNSSASRKQNDVIKSPGLVIELEDLFSPGQCRSGSSSSRRKSGLILGRAGNKTPPSSSNAPLTNGLTQTPKTPVLSSIVSKPFRSNIPKPLSSKITESGGKETVARSKGTSKSKATKANAVAGQENPPEDSSHDAATRPQPSRKRSHSKKLDIEHESAEPKVSDLVTNDEPDLARPKKPRASGSERASCGGKRTSQRNALRKTFVLRKDGEDPEDGKDPEEKSNRLNGLDKSPDLDEPGKRRHTFTVQRSRRSSSSSNPQSTRKRIPSRKSSLARGVHASEDIDQLADRGVDEAKDGCPQTAERPKSPIQNPAIEEETETALIKANVTHVLNNVLPRDPVAQCTEQIPPDNATVVTLMDMELTDVLHPLTGVYLMNCAPDEDTGDPDDAAAPEPVVVQNIDSGETAVEPESCASEGPQWSADPDQVPSVDGLTHECLESNTNGNPLSERDGECPPAEVVEDVMASDSADLPVTHPVVNGTEEIGGENCTEESISAPAGDKAATTRVETPSETPSTNVTKVRGTIMLVKNTPSSGTSSRRKMPPPALNDPCCSKSLSQFPDPALDGGPRRRRKNAKYFFGAESDDSDSDFDPGSSVKKKPISPKRPPQAKSSNLSKGKRVRLSKKLLASKKRPSVVHNKLLDLDGGNLKDGERPKDIDIYDAKNISNSLVDADTEGCASVRAAGPLQTKEVPLGEVGGRKEDDIAIDKTDDEAEVTIIKEVQAPGRKKLKKQPEKQRRKPKSARDSTKKGNEDQDPGQAAHPKETDIASKSSGAKSTKKMGAKKGPVKSGRPRKSQKVSTVDPGVGKRGCPKQDGTDAGSRDETAKSNAEGSLKLDMQLCIEVADLVKSVRRSGGGELHEKELSVVPSSGGEVLRIKDRSSGSKVIDVPLSKLKDVSNSHRDPSASSSSQKDTQRDSDKENEGSVSPELAKHQPKVVGQLANGNPLTDEEGAAVAAAAAAAEALRRRKPVSYKEPSLSLKMRRP